MAPSIVDKYEQILAADPRSRIFVELAKALVERGEHVRAVEVCQRGLEHHPSSILGRVIWGRALLEAGDAKGALDQFEIAIALEPSSPYAYNHVGEALLKKGLFKDALPVLARAAELQPADARVRAWLEEAKRRAKGEPPAPAPALGGIALEDEKTEPYRPLVSARGPAAPANGTGAAHGAAGTNGAVRADGALAEPPAPAAPPNAATNVAAGANGTPASPAANGAAATVAPAPAPANGVSKPPPLPPGAAALPAAPRSVLYMIPGDTREVIGPAAPRPRPAAPAAPAAPETDPAEAERIAAQYERELRERLGSAAEPPPSFLDRHRRLLAAGAVALALGAAAGVWLFVDRQNAVTLAKSAAARGRAGLARDTLGSLREAHRLLGEARRRGFDDPEIVSLAAQVAALLATEHGDADARAIAERLAQDPAAGDGAVAARWLLADGAKARRAAEAELLAARPSSAPLVQALAGRILVAKGEKEGGRGRLEIAARANPPLLRALSDLGDLALSSGDPDGALVLYGGALAAHPTHPRSAVGAAEARLALGKDLEAARRVLLAVDADAASLPPADLRPRFEVALARVTAALGDPAAAAGRLQKAFESLGESAPLADALAELHLAARAWDRAEAAAARAVRLEPREPSHRALLARARIGRGRFAEALAATEGQDGRAIRVQRAIARYRLGQWAEARAELEKTAKDGKVPVEAAVWVGLVDAASGHADRAVPLLEKLAAADAPPPLAAWACGRALEAAGRPDEAEDAYRDAITREPGAPEPHLALGTLLLARARAKDAILPLERAAKLDPQDLVARRTLGAARLAAGHPAAARADLDFVLLAAPRDAAALRLLSAAWLAEGEPAEARRAAERAVAAAPRDPDVLVTSAKAALAAGDAAAARANAKRALGRGASGETAVEAKRVIAAAGGPTAPLPRKKR
jgi:tetratricopeptide (TPR) repeat protein